jgi:hypothetical protein
MNLRIACNRRLILLRGELMNGVPLPIEMRLLWAWVSEQELWPLTN